MANNFIKIYKEHVVKGDRTKCQIIMNYRHAFRDVVLSDGSKPNNFGKFIFESFPNKTANVMINSFRVMLGTTDHKVLTTVIQDGLWDASFKLSGKYDLGFSFNDSPFGKDNFDYWYKANNLKYQDVFTGFVFYEPFENHVYRSGIPNLVSKDFEDEILRRHMISGDSISIDTLKRIIIFLVSLHIKTLTHCYTK